MQSVFVVVSLTRDDLVHREVARLPNYRTALDFLVRHQANGRRNLDMLCEGRFVAWEFDHGCHVIPDLLGMAEWEPLTPQPLALVAA